MAAMTRSVEALEKDFAAWLGVPAALATGYGRSAALLAFQVVHATGNGPSGACEILVPNFICRQIPEALRRARATLRFYPVGRDLAIRPEDLRAACTPSTRAALVPHYFGQAQPHIAALAEACRELQITLLEDCALALGAQASTGQPAGTFGDLSIFSNTKSDWCFGGGLLTARDSARAQQARSFQSAEFVPACGSALAYGLLRRADFASNRPSRARLADFAGRWLEWLCGMRGANFYDAARYDSYMPAFAARRARRLLKNLAATTARRQRILAAFYEALRDTPLLFRPQLDPGDAGSFLLLHAPGGHAAEWRERAAANGVTLRLVWPAYKQPEPEQASADLAWLADHLLFLEVHPGLSEGEIDHIVRTLKKLAGEM